MEGIQSQWISSLLGFAAFILGLSVLVQIVQESFKYLSSSKDRAYSRLLSDFLGPWAMQLKQTSFMLTVRGPFQFLRIRPQGVLLPMDRDQLEAALIKTAQPWVQKTYQLLTQEMNWQSGTEKKPSLAWCQFLEDLGKVEKGMLGYWNAYEIMQWLTQWGHTLKKDLKNDRILGQIKAPPIFGAKELCNSFQERFLQHVSDAKTNFPQFDKNFDYAYRRKNLKQTIFIALVISLSFNFSAGRIWNRVQRMSAKEAASLAETYLTMSDKITKEMEVKDSGKSQAEVMEKLEEVKTLLTDYAKELSSVDKKSEDVSFLQLIKLNEVAAGASAFSWEWIVSWIKYIFLCLLTALLIGVGAPVWNDLVKFLLGLQQGKFKKPLPENGGDRG